MKLGLYYHIPCYKDAFGNIFTASYFGVFIDALAANCESLSVFLHHVPQKTANEDYKLQSANIEWVDMGGQSPFYKRLLSPSRYLNIIKRAVISGQIDGLIVRAPSPLAPHIMNRISAYCKVHFLLVGSYTEGLSGLKQPWYRRYPIIMINYLYQYLQDRSVRNRIIFANSEALFNQYKNVAAKATLIKTTTLSKNDFFYRDDTCLNNEYRLLYTGRITFAKGLRELIDAMAVLVHDQGVNLHLDIVGWEDGHEKPVEKELLKQASNKHLGERIIFHGKKAVGPELFGMYRKADIYIIPSYHEGFPRTIWEAMAASLPVIATKVGSIPFYLTNRTNALLIAPQKVNELTEAILTVIKDSILRKKLIREGYKLAEDVTLDKQTTKLIDTLKNEYSGN